VGEEEWCSGKGLDWERLRDKTAACPYSWPFGTRFVLPGGEEFVCLDRLARRFGEGWVDLLLGGTPPVPYGTMIEVEVTFP